MKERQARFPPLILFHMQSWKNPIEGFRIGEHRHLWISFFFFHWVMNIFGSYLLPFSNMGFRRDKKAAANNRHLWGLTANWSVVYQNND